MVEVHELFVDAAYCYSVIFEGLSILGQAQAVCNPIWDPDTLHSTQYQQGRGVLLSTCLSTSTNPHAKYQEASYTLLIVRLSLENRCKWSAETL